MNSIIKLYQTRSDLIKPFESVCDKFVVSYDEQYPLSRTIKRSKSYQRFSKVLTNSNSDSYRQSRLSVQLQLMKSAFDDFKLMLSTRKVTRLRVRDLA